MKYQFKPYTMMQSISVTLTGNVYEKGEHPTYTEHKIIEVVDEQGEMHYAFEDEITSDEVKEKERMYSEEDFKLFARQFYREIKMDKSNLLWEELADKCFEQFKKK